MSGLELLRFGWTPNQLKLLLVAMADAGPVARPVWVARSGVPRNHLAAVLGECERLGGCKAEPGPEGLAIRVLPVEFWRVTPLMERAQWALAWRGVVQERLDLATERPGLAEALGELQGAGERLQVRGGSSSRTDAVREACPESGSGSGSVSGVVTGFGVKMPGFRESVCPDSGRPNDRDRDREVIEKDRSFSRLDRDRGRSSASHREGKGAGGGREYVLTKLRRIPRLEAEVMRPQTDGQRRLSRIFWEMEQADSDWLERTLAELVDNTAILNKAAWFNTAVSKLVEMKRRGDAGRVEA